MGSAIDRSEAVFVGTNGERARLAACIASDDGTFEVNAASDHAPVFCVFAER